MAEKILNTRVQLKWDTIEHWNDAAAVVLKQGEPGFTTITVKQTNANGAIVNVPVTLMKVGDGSSAFSALPWMSALAADVFPWAKEANITIAQEGAGNVISGIAWDATLNGGKGGLKYTTASVATAEGLEALQKEVYGENSNADNSRIDQIEKQISDNTDAWAANTTYGIGIEGKVITLTPSVGEAQTITVPFLTAEEIAALITTVSGENAIKVAQTDVDYKVSLALDNSGNVALSQSEAGLKAEVDIPEYTITKDEASSDYAAVYHLQKDGTNIGAAINIPKDMVVQSGEVRALEADEITAERPQGTYIVLTLANATNDELFINVGDLIEYVTGATAADGIITTTVSEDYKVTATINDGTITLAKLEADIQTKLGYVDTGKSIATAITEAVAPAQQKADNAYALAESKEDAGTAQELIDALKLSETYEPIGAENRAKEYADGKFVYSAKVNEADENETLMQGGNILILYCGGAFDN